MPVDIHGKTYWTVAERLNLANGEGYEPPKIVVKTFTELLAIGNLAYVRATVTFAGAQEYTGLAMLNMDARSPAEKNAPLETAETSAIGRALAFAGYYGSPEGIAGAEEILLAQERERQRGQAAEQRYESPPRQPTFADGSSPVTRMGSGAAPRPVGNPGGPSPSQVRFANQLWADAGRPMPPPDWEGMTGRDVSRQIDELKASVRR